MKLPVSLLTCITALNRNFTLNNMQHFYIFNFFPTAETTFLWSDATQERKVLTSLQHMKCWILWEIEIGLNGAAKEALRLTNYFLENEYMLTEHHCENKSPKCELKKKNNLVNTLSSWF